MFLSDHEWLSILPPILTIALAIISRQVVISLLTGILSSSVLLNGFTLKSLSEVFDHYIIQSFANQDHAYILLFSFCIAGMVGVIIANGGMNALVSRMASWAKNRQRTEFISYLLGIAIFFDDYANTLIVGNTMQPLAHRNKVSKAKLAYIVDSTAAPVAVIAFVTTWIGAELGYISEGLNNSLNAPSAYQVFLSSLPFSFYPILTLVFIAILIWTGKDFGPMARANSLSEQETTDNSSSIQGSSAWKAVLPVLILIVSCFTFLYYTGKTKDTKTLGEIIGNASVYKSLLWSSALSLFVAILSSLSGASLKNIIKSMYDGFQSIFDTAIILLLAWAFASAITNIGTADYILSLIEGNLSISYLPLIVFLFSAIVSFTTGTSWGTMAIMIPLSMTICMGLTTTISTELLGISIASVLGGAVFGDHCSPISDTTILSSMATGCDHIEHVKTQMPYALTTAAISATCLLLYGFGIPTLLIWTLAILGCWGVIYFLGKKNTESI